MYSISCGRLSGGSGSPCIGLFVEEDQLRRLYTQSVSDQLPFIVPSSTVIFCNNLQYLHRRRELLVTVSAFSRVSRATDESFESAQPA